MPDSKAKTAWKNANTTRIVMNLNHRTDADILRKLEMVKNKQGYIKSLIRSDLEADSCAAADA